MIPIILELIAQSSALDLGRALTVVIATQQMDPAFAIKGGPVPTALHLYSVGSQNNFRALFFVLKKRINVYWK